MSDSRSQYFEPFAAIMKITLRDGDATDDEKGFLQRLGKKLGITGEEYFELIESYMLYKISAPFTVDDRLESMFLLSEIVYNDDQLTKKLKEKWLKRMGVAIGLDPTYIGHIVTRTLDLYRENRNLEMSRYIDSIRELLS